MKPQVIYSDAIDGKALAQFFDALKQDWVVRGALMPDAHAGYSLPIGAVVATEGMIVPAWVGVIPGSMRDGSFVVRGKGNPDSLCSSSHGAGRVMGRAEAKRTLDMAIFKQEMEDRGIQARVDASTLDESAGAYKDVFSVMALQREMVDVVHHLKPIINIKG